MERNRQTDRAGRLPPRGGGVRGFSIIELLVVIGIIGVLLSLLLPTLTQARRQAQTVKCMAQLREIGHHLLMYAIDNRGWLYPVGEWDESRETYNLVGHRRHPGYRWPMLIFEFDHPPIPVPEPTDQDRWPVEEIRPFIPPIMRCPTDIEPPHGHSYVLNAHLIERRESIRLGSGLPGGRSPSEVVLMGEKKTDVADYYMQRNEYERVAAPYRHGLWVGANYLYLDYHATTRLPPGVRNGAGPDPWDPWQ